MRQQAARGGPVVVAGTRTPRRPSTTCSCPGWRTCPRRRRCASAGSTGWTGDLSYIGRRHVHDQNLDPVVIDWRAPVAEAFYQASWGDPAFG
ncbi:MAG TPA: hypothetical protein VGR13_01550 [Actinomycetota bacterium]|nr:hypothetical protein [Actinomycetota bacterium]